MRYLMLMILSFGMMSCLPEKQEQELIDKTLTAMHKQKLEQEIIVACSEKCVSEGLYLNEDETLNKFEADSPDITDVGVEFNGYNCNHEGCFHDFELFCSCKREERISCVLYDNKCVETTIELLTEDDGRVTGKRLCLKDADFCYTYSYGF